MLKTALPAEAFGEGVALPAEALCESGAICTRSVHWGRRYITTTTEGRSGHTVKNLRFVTKTLLVMRPNEVRSHRTNRKKLLLAMKLTVILLTVGFLNVSAKGISQNVSFSGDRVSLKSVFSSVTKQTGFAFIYPKSILENSKPVSISVSNVPLEQFLAELLLPHSLTFKFKGKNIVISPKPFIENITSGADVPYSPIRGRVLDDDDQPLIGASVSVKNSKTVGVTDAEGVFTLNVNEGDVIVVTFVGYQSKDVKVSSSMLNGGTLNISLSKASTVMDETVVIAYGTTTKRLNTGNVSSVKASDIEKQPVNNPLLALQGRVTGLIIKQGSGISGAGVTVQIQGQNSIANGNNPIYVIDGVPYVSEFPATLVDAVILNGNPLSYINPNDIESIDVLKDADATAIYGSRAANGAILITTKKGKAGATKVDLNFQQGWGSVTRKIEMMNTQQYLAMRHQAYQNDGVTTIPASAFDLKLWDTTRYTDWQKTLIGETSQYTNANASVSGGTANIQYLISGTYHRETTVFPGDFSDQKGAIHFNLNSISSNKKFRVQFLANYMLDKNQLPSKDLTQSAIMLEPNAPLLYNSDGQLNWAPNASGTSTWSNPLTILYSKYTNKTNNLVSNAVLGYQILPGLEFKSSFGYTNMQTNDFASFPKISLKPESRPNSSSVAQYGSRNLNSWSIEPQLNYKKNVFKGKLDALIGATILENNNESEQLIGVGYSSDEVLRNIAAATTIQTNTYISKYRYTAFFGRLNYNWLDKYIINLNIRRDGSSRFGSENAFHNFGSVGAAWLFGEEKFMKGISLFSFGKLRASYGSTGNDQIGNYSFLSLYDFVPNYGQPYQGGTGLLPSRLPNAYLQWEETRKLQGGLDLGFLADKILLSINYAHNRSSNQLLSYALPSITGFDNILRNFPATVQNSSWEFTLNTTNVKTSSLSWTSSINLTIPNNKLISFPNLASSPFASTLIIGKPLGIERKFHFLGVDPTTGLYQFMDSHGNATINPDFDTDRIALISTLPKFYGGLQNSFDYKGFQFDILFQFVKQLGNNAIYFNNGVNVVPGVFRAGLGNQPVTLLNAWQKPGDNVYVAKYSSVNGGPSRNSLSNIGQSDAINVDASFIRLKNLSLSWQLPEAWQRKARLKNCSIYLQGQNLLTITTYKGLDPENQGFQSLPPLRVLTVGFRTRL